MLNLCKNIKLPIFNSEAELMSWYRTPPPLVRVLSGVPLDKEKCQNLSLKNLQIKSDICRTPKPVSDVCLCLSSTETFIPAYFAVHVFSLTRMSYISRFTGIIMQGWITKPHNFLWKWLGCTVWSRVNLDFTSTNFRATVMVQKAALTYINIFFINFFRASCNLATVLM